MIHREYVNTIDPNIDYQSKCLSMIYDKTNVSQHWGEPHDGCSCNHRHHGRGGKWVHFNISVIMSWRNPLCVIFSTGNIVYHWNVYGKQCWCCGDCNFLVIWWRKNSPRRWLQQAGTMVATDVPRRMTTVARNFWRGLQWMTRVAVNDDGCSNFFSVAIWSPHGPLFCPKVIKY